MWTSRAKLLARSTTAYALLAPAALLLLACAYPYPPISLASAPLYQALHIRIALPLPIAHVPAVKHDTAASATPPHPLLLNTPMSGP
jgi:hypothetical protein